MEATEERRAFDEVLEILRALGNGLKAALYFGGLSGDSLDRMKVITEQLNKMNVSDFIGSWLKMPSNRELLEVYVNEVLQTYYYHGEVENANFKPEQIGEDYVKIAKTYDRWRNTIIFKLAECLPDGAAMMYDHKKYVMFPDGKNKLRRKQPSRIKEVSFKDCLLAKDIDGLLAKLHTLIDGQKGKYVAEVIYTCCKVGIIKKKPSFAIIEEEFGEVGSKQGFNSYYGKPNTFKWEEVESIKGHLMEFV